MAEAELLQELANQLVGYVVLFLGQIKELFMFECEVEERAKSIRWRLEREALERQRRRRIRLRMLQLLGSASVRSVWRKQRPQGSVFWSEITNVFGDNEWLKHFRMTRSTFDFIFVHVEPFLRRSGTNRGLPLEPRLKLAVTLWWYANPCEYRSISSIFGIGISTVFLAVRQVTRALKRSLLKRFISLPCGPRLQETIDGFYERGYPMCAGAIDGTHVPITAPQGDASAYLNREGWHSIFLQAVVDHNYRFIDVFVGRPGRTEDAQVLANSPIFRTAEEQGGFLFPREKSMDVDGVEVPVHLIGDRAYPLMNWLMTGFTHRHAPSPPERRFNYQLSSARTVVDDAFRRLKGRWRCLAKRTDVATSFLTDVAVVCCILHNVCETKNERYLPEWDAEQRGLSEPLPLENHGVAARDAQAIRESIMSVL